MIRSVQGHDVLDPDDKESGSMTSKSQKVHVSRLMACASIATLVTTVLSIYLFFVGFLDGRVPYSMHDARVQSALKRPSTYMNLEKLPFNRTLGTFPPIYNFAHILLQFEDADPSRSLREASRRYQSPVGEIYPDDRYFLTSTVVQFRNMDYGMERCVLDPTIPNPNITISGFDPAVNVQHGSEIDIWLLDGSQELSRHVLWTRAPPRQKHFGKIGFSGQGFRHMEFICPSMSFTTFEFSCAPETPQCHVEFWQKKAEPPNGVYMVQHDSRG
ncbi:hypothetical protein D9615_010507 [Tricholomella constricta]|uniref:Ubiquitin 3 binding protein But2 C-terminal domain-containing protein n=1 Tax=Tricholomella constricta TaxID=117010 RepID=A0A8H5LRW8_9AGAR|nr:hypothetical protein D9615_010507 [Tricholomella constricta]